MNYTYDQLEQAMKNNNATRQDFFKTILTIASTMLSILAAFHTGHDGSKIQFFLYVSCVVLLSLGTLTGGIVLYFEVLAAKSLFAQLKKEISKQLSSSFYDAAAIVYNPPKFFYICEKTSYVSLLLSVLLTALYAALKV